MRKTTLIALAVALCSTSAAPANQWNRVTVPNGALVYDMAIQGGILWLSTRGDGLMGYDDGQWVMHRAEDGGIRTNSFNYTVFVDSAGDKWVGRDNTNAVDRLDDAGTFSDKTDDAWTYYTYEVEMETRRVFAMAEIPDGGMWFGQRDESHNRVGTVELMIENSDTTTADDVWYHYDNAWTPDSTSFSSDDVRHLAIDSAGRLWIGYYASGVDVWDYGDPSIFADDSWQHYADDSGLPSDLVNDIHVADDGDVWVGTVGGLAVYERASGSWSTIGGLPGVQAKTVDTDALGHVWVGTEDGVAMLYGNGTVAATYGVDDGIPDETVSRISVDRERGIVWAISVDEGTQATSLSYYESGYAAGETKVFVYPNPCKVGESGPEITVFGAPEGSDVTILDMTGEELRELEPTEPYVWDTLDDDRNEVPSGVYIIRVETPSGDVAMTKAAIIR